MEAPDSGSSRVERVLEGARRRAGKRRSGPRKGGQRRRGGDEEETRRRERERGAAAAEEAAAEAEEEETAQIKRGQRRTPTPPRAAAAAAAATPVRLHCPPQWRATGKSTRPPSAVARARSEWPPRAPPSSAVAREHRRARELEEAHADTRRVACGRLLLLAGCCCCCCWLAAAAAAAHPHALHEEVLVDDPAALGERALAQLLNRRSLRFERRASVYQYYRAPESRGRQHRWSSAAKRGLDRSIAWRTVSRASIEIAEMSSTLSSSGGMSAVSGSSPSLRGAGR